MAALSWNCQNRFQKKKNLRLLSSSLLIEIKFEKVLAGKLNSYGFNTGGCLICLSNKSNEIRHLVKTGEWTDQNKVNADVWEPWIQNGTQPH